MRVFPPPLSVTLPPPSMTTGPVSLWTFASVVRTMVLGSGPQSNVMTPPFATAATNASPVQLSGEPLPTTVRGFAMLSAAASPGTAHLPSVHPGAGPSLGFVVGPPLAVLEPDELAPPPLLPPLDEEEIDVSELPEQATTARTRASSQ